jgi:hypothetical protein
MTSDDHDLSAPNGAPATGSADNSQEKAPGDPLGVFAIVVGCVGLLVLGILLTLVTAMLAAIAGQKAREERRSPENAYIAFGLAALDGVVWIVLHLVFDLKFAAG